MENRDGSSLSAIKDSGIPRLQSGCRDNALPPPWTASAPPTNHPYLEQIRAQTRRQENHAPLNQAASALESRSATLVAAAAFRQCRF